jgi:hypothetical protein
MKNVHNAVTDALYDLGYANVRENVHADPNSENERWTVELLLDEKRLFVEVIQGDPHVYACVLNNTGFSNRFVNGFMDALMDYLDED